MYPLLDNPEPLQRRRQRLQQPQVAGGIRGVPRLRQHGPEGPLQVRGRALAGREVRRRYVREVPGRHVVDPPLQLGPHLVRVVDQIPRHGRHAPARLHDARAARRRVDDGRRRRPEEERQEHVALPAALERVAARVEGGVPLAVRVHGLPAALEVRGAQHVEDQGAHGARARRVHAHLLEVVQIIIVRRLPRDVDERVRERERLGRPVEDGGLRGRVAQAEALPGPQ
mmetsp:Transcript_8937/g.26816  ORF Transcript_8937/g.26816 Transcript_8937/m.26816 type:complete len:227 (+) Transcript_8937:12-692(+)